ncbi:MAG TPA: hypothetical protein VK436_08610 [Methanocella sp.]|nr:hypothetical protein [Methanocella sp.]
MKKSEVEGRRRSGEEYQMIKEYEGLSAIGLHGYSGLADPVFVWLKSEKPVDPNLFREEIWHYCIGMPWVWIGGPSRVKPSGFSG